MDTNPGPIPVDGSTVHLAGVAVPVLQLSNPNAFPIVPDLSLLLMPSGWHGGDIPVRGAALVPAQLTVPPYSTTMVGIELMGRSGHLSVTLGHALAPATAGSTPWGTRLPAVLSCFATISAVGGGPAAAAMVLTQQTAGPWNDPAERIGVCLFDTDHFGPFDINIGLRLPPSAVAGTCVALLTGGESVPATRMLTGSTRYVLLVVDSGRLAVVDDAGTRGVEHDLAGETIATAVVDGSIEIAGERFSTG